MWFLTFLSKIGLWKWQTGEQRGGIPMENWLARKLGWFNQCPRCGYYTPPTQSKFRVVLNLPHIYASSMERGFCDDFVKRYNSPTRPLKVEKWNNGVWEQDYPIND